MRLMTLLVVVLSPGCVLNLNENKDAGTTVARGSCTQTYTSASPNFKVCTQYTGNAFLSAATLSQQQTDCTAATTSGSVFTWSASGCPTANAFGKCSIDYRGTSNDISAEAVYYNDNLTAATTARTACMGTTAQGATLTWGSLDGTGGGADGGGGTGSKAYLCVSGAAGVPSDAIFPPEACTPFSTTPSVSNSSWSYTTAADGVGGAGTSSWEGANLSITGTWGQAGCMMSNVRVTACPVNGLLGICKDTTHNTAFYYYSGWIFTAATARAMCQSATYLGSGPGTQVSQWFATP